MKATIIILLAIIAFSFQACREELRGEVEQSLDGKTYLAFENGCDSLYVNGEFWPHNFGVKGEVPAGVCVIGCGGNDTTVSIDIDKGTIFHFDYWGP